MLCLLLTVEWTIAKLIAHPVNIDETATILTAIPALRNRRICLTAVGGALTEAATQFLFILAFRTVACQIVDFVRVDRTARIGAEKILKQHRTARIAFSTWNMSQPL